MFVAERVPRDVNDQTDYSRWRLKADDNGRHVWHYLKTDEECAAWPQTTYDKYWLGLDTNMPALPPATDPLSAARKGFRFLKALQAPDGHWPGEYGGPMFLIPGLVIGSYVADMPFEEEEKTELIRYLMNLAHPEDGGWGLHIEGPSTAFGTALNYTAARLLGASSDHPIMAKARRTLHKLGGAAAVPSWGKFWLSLLNVYDWEGNNPIPPELWLLPDSIPIHPHRWWIHTRQVYIPMSYIYGLRYQAPESSIILELRKELYVEDYYKIDWPKQRNNVCSVDVYAPHTKLLDFLNGVLGAYEMCGIPPLRRKALDVVYRMICEEDDNTSYQDLGPVNKMVNLVCRFLVEGKDSVAYEMHKLKRKDFLWIGPQGMRMCGTNGSQLWDTAFISQALVESGLADDEENHEACLKALDWLDKAQIQDNPIHFEKAYRQATKGAWPFSTKEQGYTVSDCTGEGPKKSMKYH
ncbi:hypothetical protein Clacol_005458 [Clathrus columnatus]|uniref:Squalene cyclase N-terminal domain-containing protein n=1 Tax=Clathrus columnatus TaxID=1419009 RepID=A0AAV5AFH0_9AGAM|nr:hypothetical protein Clacol_005458 [Clathrus columnatus]